MPWTFPGATMPRALVTFLFLLCLPSAAGGQDLEEAFPGANDLAPLQREGPVAFYTPDTLWERIDGEAALFRRFGVLEAAFARYSRPGNPDESLEIALYWFPHSLSAYGIFAFFRPGGSPLLDFGNGSILGEYQGFLWSGARFATVNAFGPPEATGPGIRKSLEVLNRRLRPHGAVPESLAAMGKVLAGRDIQYRPDHLLGREALPPGLQGEDGQGVLFFLATTPVDAEAVLSAYGTVLSHVRSEEDGGIRYLSGTDPDLGPVTVAVTGEHLAGARLDRPDEGQRELLRQLLGVPLP